MAGLVQGGVPMLHIDLFRCAEHAKTTSKDWSALSWGGGGGLFFAGKPNLFVENMSNGNFFGLKSMRSN